MHEDRLKLIKCVEYLIQIFFVLTNSTLQLDDDELAARANKEPISRYPEEYQIRAQAQDHELGSVDVEHSSRVILPSEVGVEGANILHDHVPATKLKVPFKTLLSLVLIPGST